MLGAAEGLASHYQGGKRKCSESQQVRVAPGPQGRLEANTFLSLQRSEPAAFIGCWDSLVFCIEALSWALGFPE